LKSLTKEIGDIKMVLLHTKNWKDDC